MNLGIQFNHKGHKAIHKGHKEISSSYSKIWAVVKLSLYTKNSISWNWFYIVFKTKVLLWNSNGVFTIVFFCKHCHTYWCGFWFFTLCLICIWNLIFERIDKLDIWLTFIDYLGEPGIPCQLSIHLAQMGISKLNQGILACIGKTPD